MKKQGKRAVDNLFDFLEIIVMAMFVVVLVFTFVFRTVNVQGQSMQDTLFENDSLVISKLLYTPKQGDIVVVNSSVLDNRIIKRIIAVEGQKVEIDNNARPKLATHIQNLNDYDVVFIGFPNWWYNMPMPLYSFFDEYDFGGKSVIPFCTHGGSRFSDAIKTIRELEPKASVLDGYAIPRDRVSEAKPNVLNWLKRIGMAE